MADQLEEMPLFPLHTVLFPYAQLQLHVFEPRYREMVRYCTQNDIGFGVVLIREGEETGQSDPYMVGTAVRIAKVQTYDDGQMDVRIVGQRRFRIRRLDEESKPYIVGYVEPVIEAEIEGLPTVESLSRLIKKSVQEYIQSEFLRADVKVQHINLPSEPVALSFVVANMLKIENIDKQRLLETTDTLSRLSELVPILEQHIVDIQIEGQCLATPEMFAEWVTPN